MDDHRKSKQNANEDEQRRLRSSERPDRPQPNAPEAPGGSREGKAEEDARNKSTREGER